MAFILFLLLAGFTWVGLRADLGLGTFGTGMALGAVVWRMEHAHSNEPFRPLRAVLLIGRASKVLFQFVWELLVANWLQLRVVLAPRIDVQPRWVHFDTRLESPALRVVLALMISLTPGSLVCDEFERPDGSVCLWIHILDGEDASAAVERIRRRLETPLRALELP